MFRACSHPLDMLNSPLTEAAASAGRVARVSVSPAALMGPCSALTGNAAPVGSVFPPASGVPVETPGLRCLKRPLEPGEGAFQLAAWKRLARDREMARLEGIRDFHRMPRPQLCSQSCFDDVDDDTETDSETEAEEVMDVALEIARRKDLLADAALAETRLRSMFHVTVPKLERIGQLPEGRLFQDMMATCLYQLVRQVTEQTGLLRTVAALPRCLAAAALSSSPMEALLVPTRFELRPGVPGRLLVAVPKVSARLTRVRGRGVHKFSLFGRFLLSVRGVDGRVVHVWPSDVRVAGDMVSCAMRRHPSGMVEITYVPASLLPIRISVLVHNVIVLRRTAISGVAQPVQIRSVRVTPALMPRSPSECQHLLVEALEKHFQAGALASLRNRLVPLPVTAAAKLALNCLRDFPDEDAVQVPALLLLARFSQHDLFRVGPAVQLIDFLRTVHLVVAQDAMLSAECYSSALAAATGPFKFKRAVTVGRKELLYKIVLRIQARAGEPVREECAAFLARLSSRKKRERLSVGE